MSCRRRNSVAQPRKSTRLSDDGEAYDLDKPFLPILTRMVLPSPDRRACDFASFMVRHLMPALDLIARRGAPHLRQHYQRRKWKRQLPPLFLRMGR